jgi:acetyl-CoA acetyltransferase
MAIKAGEVDYGIAVGVEKLAGAGLLAGGSRGGDVNTWQPSGRFGAVGPIDFELFAKISEKNHAHSTLNPLASYQKRFTLDQIMNDVMIAYPNTRPMCSANCDGAAAAVLVSGAKLKTLSLEQQRRAADLDLVELHDCFATAELVHYDNLRLCDEGGAVDFFNSGATWRDGKTPVNVSGGLESKGHPIAATGIANVWEIATHLRGEAGDRQLPNAKVGLAHVIGLGNACGVHILERAAA